MNNKNSILRSHIIHVLPHLVPCGCFSFIFTLVKYLRNYSHTLVFETPQLDHVDLELIWHLQALGCAILHTENITCEQLDSIGGTGAIFYNTTGHPKLGTALPSIYYAYGIYDPQIGTNIVVPCSRYACIHRRTLQGDQRVLNSERIIPPTIQTRAFRRLRAPKHPFTIGLFTSGSDNKYPCTEVIELLGKLPDGIRIMLTTLDKYQHPGMLLAIDDRKAIAPGTLIECPVKMYAPVRYMVQADVILYATAEEFDEPYGRLVMEALALGKPVICQNKGVFKETLENGVTALLYNNIDEALGYIDRLRNDKKMAESLGANGQMMASQSDISVYAGKIKSIFRELGI